MNAFLGFINIYSIFHFVHCVAQKEVEKQLQRRKEEEEQKKLKLDEWARKKESKEQERRERKDGTNDSTMGKSDATVEPKKKQRPAHKKAPEVFPGEIRDHGGVEYTKLQRSMRQFHAAKESPKSNTKQFEYGVEKKSASSTLSKDIWDVKPQGEFTSLGTRSYEMMASQLLTSSTDDVFTGRITRPASMSKMKVIPARTPTDEVVAVLKKAMYDVSSWLMDIERISSRKQKVLDSDLDMDLGLGEQGMSIYQDDEEERQAPPPAYASTDEVAPDRLILIYNSLTGLHNNHAHWLGDNTKLTRIKFQVASPPAFQSLSIYVDV